MNNLYNVTYTPRSWESVIYFEHYFPLVPDKALFKGLKKDEVIKWIKYFYLKPKSENIQKLSDSDRIIRLYDPFWKREEFPLEDNQYPAGIRYCINVYTGCPFECPFCYKDNYITNPHNPRIKKNFRKKLDHDLNEMRALELPPKPLHMSNSTDCLQPMENTIGDTLYTLQKINDNQDLFSMLVLLSRNPGILLRPSYLNRLKSIPYHRIEISCNLANDATRKKYMPNSPGIRYILESVKKLCEHNIHCSLRIDPLFPRNPLPKKYFKKASVQEYGISQEYHSEENLIHLVQAAKRYGCQSVIVSPLKLCFGTGKLFKEYRKLYEAVGYKKGKSLRLPVDYYKELVQPLEEEGKRIGIPVIYCKKNLFSQV